MRCPQFRHCLKNSKNFVRELNKQRIVIGLALDPQIIPESITHATKDPKITPIQLAERWGLELETSLDVTDLAFAFNRAKETEARLLHESDLIGARELIDIMNKSIAPYTHGGRHYIMRLRKK